MTAAHRSSDSSGNAVSPLSTRATMNNTSQMRIFFTVLTE